MHPLKQLQNLLQKRSPNQGTIVTSSSSEMLVATTLGSLRVLRGTGDTTNYKPGDSVILVNGQVVGRKLRSPTIYVL